MGVLTVHVEPVPRHTRTDLDRHRARWAFLIVYVKSKNRKRGGNAPPLKTPRIEEHSKADGPGPRQNQKVLSATEPSPALPPRLPLNSQQLRRKLQVLQEHSVSISLLGSSPSLLSRSHQAQVSNCCPLSPLHFSHSAFRLKTSCSEPAVCHTNTVLAAHP